MTRRSLVLAALLVASLTIGTGTPALAGEYPVYACEPAFADVNHSWFPESSSNKLAAYTACPVPVTETRTWNEGLVTRESVTTGSTSRIPGFSHALLRLRAPQGAGLARITYKHYFCGSTQYQAGLVNDAGQWLHYAGPNVCGSLLPSPWTLDLGGTRSIALAIFCAKTSCAIDSSFGGWATMRSATVWVRDYTRPSVAITGGSIIAPGWHRGTQSLAVSARDNVGLRHMDVALAGKAAVGRGGVCDWTRVVPCSVSFAGLDVDSRIAPDGSQLLTVAIEDSAGNWSSTARHVFIDNTAPAGPFDLAVLGGERWQGANRFAIRWTNPSQSGMAPIAAVNWAICPTSNAIEDYRNCRTGSKRGADIRALDGLTVPGPGDWVARFWLTDAAGNSDRATARPLHVRYDPDPPAVAILPSDPADPQRLTIAASDALAGLARVEVEIQRDGQDEWMSLPVASEGGRFVARVDDAVLPRGRYLVRARAIDAAGNERSTASRIDGTPAVLDLPLRLPTSLSVGRPRRVHSRHHRAHTVLRRRVTTRFGARVRLRGRLLLPGGNPLANATLQVFRRIALPGRHWARVGMVKTSKHGRLSYRARARSSRNLRFSYGGTPLIRPSTARIRIRVRASTSFYVNRRRVVNGDEVLFHGRVRGHVPTSGKLVQLQAYSRGTWRTFATPRARRRSHRWRHRYRFSATRGLVRYRFRAVLPPEAGFPYVRGSSRRLRVTVRGL